ncbi:hypothetical protein OROGR_015259 [Orobanche gracilis]
MSDANKDVKFSLKVIINKQKTKVLFAEADSDFTNVLLSFLTLPLGKIVRLLEQQYKDDAPVIGSLTSLYNGLSNLDSTHFSTEGAKQMLLDPISSFSDECRKLKLDVSDTQPTKYFITGSSYCRNHSPINIGMYYGTAKCKCGRLLNKEIPVHNVLQSVDGDGGVFTTTSHETFLIYDDLEIFPNVTASFS